MVFLFVCNKYCIINNKLVTSGIKQSWKSVIINKKWHDDKKYILLTFFFVTIHANMHCSERIVKQSAELLSRDLLNML